MSGTERKRRRVFKKKYLLSSKKCWLKEEKLLPSYSHLVQLYSEQLKDTWTVKVEESHNENIHDDAQVTQEPAEYYGVPLMYSMNEVSEVSGDYLIEPVEFVLLELTTLMSISIKLNVFTFREFLQAVRAKIQCRTSVT